MLICLTFVTLLLKRQMPREFIFLNVFWYLCQFQELFFYNSKENIKINNP